MTRSALVRHPHVRLIAAACVVVALAELLGLTGAFATPHGSLRAYTSSANPFFSAACLGGFGLFVANVRARELGVTSIVACTALGAALEYAVWTKLRQDVAFAWTSVGVGFAASAVLIAVARAAIFRRPEELAPGATALFVPLFIVLSNTFLDATIVLHPAVLDPQALYVESAIGVGAGFRLAQFVSSHPPFAHLLIGVYVALPIACAIVCLFEQKEGVSRDVFFAFTAVGLAGFVCYHLCPVIGPQPFFPKMWPWTIPNVANIEPAAVTGVSLDARNCIPSLHTSWALMIYWHARERGRAVGLFGLAFLVLTLLATVGLGQHYVIDLFAAFPFSLAVRGVFRSDVPWARAERGRAVGVGVALLVTWVVLIRGGATVALAAPLLVWVLAAVSVAGTLVLEERLTRAGRSASLVVVLDEHESGESGAQWLWLPFSLSGFAGLVYEVVFTKELALTFGSTARASTTVLATYMGGLALGAHVGALLSKRLRRAAGAYAACEVGIAALTALTPAMFPLIRRGYVAIAHGTDSGAAWLPVLQLVLGALAILPPTVLMGMTTPFLVRHFERSRGGGVGVSLGGLYGANTLGAAFGAILGGTMILPTLGVTRATWLAAGLNVIAGGSTLIVTRLAGRRGIAELVASERVDLVASGGVGESCTDTGAESRGRGTFTDDGLRERRVGYLVLGVGGVVTLALETSYVHLLSAVAGNSAYAFALMLFCFLLGLGLGSAAGRTWLFRKGHVGIGLGIAQALVAVAALGGLFAWSGIPSYFGSFWGFSRAETFGAREVIRGTVCAVIMLPVAFAIGFAYPLSMELVTRRAGDRSLAVMGRAMVVNTAGNIAGALVATFGLLPALGSVRTVAALGMISLGLSVAALFSEGWHAWKDRPELTWFASTFGLAAALVVAHPRELDWDELATGANVYFARQSWGHVIDHAESVEGGITSVAEARTEKGRLVRTLLTNGKFQGDDNPDGEMRAQLGFALAPLIHSTQREHALVIGFGTGVSSRTVRDAGYRDIEIAELSKDMLTMAGKYFGSVTDHVLESPGVKTFVTDGRNHLLLSDVRYDLVSIEISSIWFAGAASLYTREFYELVSSHLSRGGVLQQWVQLHRIGEEDIAAILQAVHAVYPHVWLYMIGNQGQIVACREACLPDERALQSIVDNAQLKNALAHFGGDPRRILDDRLLDTEAVEAFIAAYIKNTRSTDDSLFLEYSTPRGNVRPYRESLEANVASIREFQPESRLRGTRLKEDMKPLD